MTCEEIAALSGAAISDSGQPAPRIETVSPLGEAEAGALAYAENSRALNDDGGRRLEGVVVLAPEALSEILSERGAFHLVHPHARSAFAAVAGSMFKPRALPVEHVIDPTATVAATARVSPGAVVGAGAEVGENVLLGPGAVIGPGCRIGAGSRIGPHAVIQCADIGKDCNILAGAVIGEAGFGVAVSPEGLIDIPHLGSVAIDDAVTIGANSCVDRGLFGATRVGEGSKIDNLCHIGHNCQIGRNVVMAAYAGISGSCIIEDGVMFGGRVGTHDHITIHAGARVGGNSAVGRNIPAGETWLGSPAQPIEAEMRQVAALRRLTRASRKKAKD
nr:UDP-3-O-(3-hydroxymyristoyl)glucosamine N-acyltransferase [Maricaulis parjimensis]